jgi:hypothetical protein
VGAGERVKTDWVGRAESSRPAKGFRQEFSMAIFVVLFAVLHLPQCPIKDGDAKIVHLSKEHTKAIRNAVYDQGLATSMSGSGELRGKRYLPVPTAISDAHEKNRIETLELLQQIVVGSNPKDSNAASAYVYALEKSKIAASAYADAPTKSYDDVGIDGKTTRETNVEVTNKLLNAAKERIEKKKQK